MQPSRPKIVLDTNTLVGSAYAASSASRRIVEDCLGGELMAILSPALRREYERILDRAVRRSGYAEALRRLIDQATVVEPTETPRIAADDPEDDKLLAVALAAGADAIITSDRHLLGLDPFGMVRILRPVEFVRCWLRH